MDSLLMVGLKFAVIIQEVDKMDISIILYIFMVFVFGVFIFLYIRISNTEEFCMNLAELLSRTLDFYYKNENIKPFMINNGIDLVYNPSAEFTDELGFVSEDLSNQKGFITIWYQGADCKTPILDVKDADILSEKIIKVVQKHIKDREMGVEK